MGALTTLTAVKLHLGTNDDTDDALLTQLINQASDDIETRCNRTLTRETRTIERYLQGGVLEPSVYLYLDLYPVESVAEIKIDDVVVTDFTLYKEAGRLYRADGWRPKTEILATYTGGYRLEPVAAVTGPPAVAAIPRTMPYNLEFAAILWVATAYNSRGSEHLSEENIGPLKSVFWKEQPAITAIVEKYRRVNI